MCTFAPLVALPSFTRVFIGGVGVDGNRRARLLRIQFRRPVHVRLASGGVRARLWSENLSLGGMFVRSDRTPRVGTHVLIWLEASGRVLPFALAEVVYRRTPEEAALYGGIPGFGVKFVGMRARARELVTVLVQTLMPHRAIGGRGAPQPIPLAG